MAYFIQSICPVLNHFQKENLPVASNSGTKTLRSYKPLIIHVDPLQGLKRKLCPPLGKKNLHNLQGHKSGIFQGMQIVIQLSSVEQSKLKSTLRKNVIDNGGQVSYTVTRDSSLIVSGTSDISAEKLNVANRFNVPVVTTNYIDDCLNQNTLLEIKEYSLMNKLQSEAFQKGKIKVAKPLTPITNLTKAKVLDQIEAVVFQGLEQYDLIKAVLLVSANRDNRAYKKSVEGKYLRFITIELHMLKAEYSKDASHKYCVFTHEGDVQITESNQNEEFGKKLCRFTNSVDTARAVFCNIYHQMTSSPNFLKDSQDFLHPCVGTPAFRASLSDLWSANTDLDRKIKVLVVFIWNEAKLRLSQYLENADTLVPEWQVKEAEALLVQIIVALSKNKLALVKKLSKEFYSLIRFKEDQSLPLTDPSDIVKKMELCKTLMNFALIIESMSLSTKGTTLSVFKALKCQITTTKVSDQVLPFELSDTDIVIHNVYSVKRNLESNRLENDVSNCKYLFHGTASSNLLGIFMQGLSPSLSTLLNFYGLENTEECMLGFGIYFSETVKGSIRFSKPSQSGTSFLLVYKVSLGNVYKAYEPHTSLVSAPSGYDSVQGVKSEEGHVTCFQENEYVIYKEDQIELCYLIEFQLPNQKFPSLVLGDSEFEKIETSSVLVKSADSSKYNMEEYIPDTKEEIMISSLKEVRSSESESTQRVPLESTHIRAYIVDLVARVTVFQVYKSSSFATRELQYTFPLSEGAAVCGFEAFIGDKHLIGEVKEKKAAHVEFQEAVSQGHGAYLLDEERPDVFTARIGNLPPNTTAIIKITYITELSVDAETLRIVFPQSLSPAQEQQDRAASSKTNVTFAAGLEMATDILTILSPSHAIKVKSTDTKAVVKLCEFSPWLNGLVLLIRMADIHIPRMWIEQHPEKNSQVCMVSYYPEFEVKNSEKNTEITLLIDASNSMSGSSFQTSLTVALLCLKHFTRNIFFNIIAFGITFKELFPESQQFNAKTKAQAIEFLRNLFPEMGGSNLYPALKSCNLLTKFQNSNVFLISDGYFECDNMLCSKISKLEHVRLFTFAVNQNSNTHFLKLSSNCSGGAYEEFLESGKSKWPTKVKEQVAKASQLSLSDVNIEWQQFDPEGEGKLIVAPQKIKSLFSGSFLVAYGFVSNCTVATLKAKILEQEYTTVVASHQLNQSSGTLIHSLAARAFIRDWEDGILEERNVLHVAQKESRKEDIISMAVAHSLVTSLTSFLAVEKRSKDEVITESPSLDVLLLDCNVDILPYIGFNETLSIPADPVEDMVPSHSKLKKMKCNIPLGMSHLEGTSITDENIRRRRSLSRSPTKTKSIAKESVCNLIDFPLLPPSTKAFVKTLSKKRRSATKKLGKVDRQVEALEECETEDSCTTKDKQLEHEHVEAMQFETDSIGAPIDEGNIYDYDDCEIFFAEPAVDLRSRRSQKHNLLKFASAPKRHRDFPWTESESNRSEDVPISLQNQASRSDQVCDLLDEIPEAPLKLLRDTRSNYALKQKTLLEIQPNSFATSAQEFVSQDLEENNVNFSPLSEGYETMRRRQRCAPKSKRAAAAAPPLPPPPPAPPVLGLTNFIPRNENSVQKLSSQPSTLAVTPPGSTFQGFGACSSTLPEFANLLPLSANFSSLTGLQLACDSSHAVAFGSSNFTSNLATKGFTSASSNLFSNQRCVSSANGIQPHSSHAVPQAFGASNSTTNLARKGTFPHINYHAFASPTSTEQNLSKPIADYKESNLWEKPSKPSTFSKYAQQAQQFPNSVNETEDLRSYRLVGGGSTLLDQSDVDDDLTELCSTDSAESFYGSPPRFLDGEASGALSIMNLSSSISEPVLPFISILQDKTLSSLNGKTISFLENTLNNFGGGFPLCGMIFKILSQSHFPAECNNLKDLEDSSYLVTVQSHVDSYWKVISDEFASGTDNIFVKQGILSMIALHKSGLQSMGTIIQERIVKLMKMTSFVYTYLISYFIPCLADAGVDTNFADCQLMNKLMAEKFLAALADFDEDFTDQQVLEACCVFVCTKQMIKIDEKYSLLYSTLNLGNSWEGEIVKNLLELSK